MTEFKKAILLNRKDNVATAILPIKKGDNVVIIYNNEVVAEVISQDDIDMYHKIAITPIKVGDLIYKYGEVIGRATDYINTGQHVHVNNIESVMTK
ncbi:UxaA family hydrolase [Fonticella tunisiensis]|uniref:Altronate dehydratase small subunit n=1 Tax=Fonticella tunisiensis TaxID=1096341 RepID=A0A4R7KU79_9CLOT|nr:UxaA family hydrolase [Fonticella tunisiensis]TDT63609.1 altronate dehydratase small subunit [Fonticella tunisiensis]